MTSKQTGWFKRLNIEHDNLRTALDWFEKKEEGKKGLRLSGALWRFWHLRGHLSEGRDRLKRILEQVCDAADSLRARAFQGAGNLARQQGDYDQSMDIKNDY